MSLRIIKRNPSGQDKEVLLEIDPVGSGSTTKTYSVKGKVLQPNDEPEVNKQVVAYHVGLGVNDRKVLGNTATTSATGEYLIYYTTDELEGNLYADLTLKVFDEGADIATADPIGESGVYVSALPNEEVDILTSDEDYIGPTEFAQLAADLTNYINDEFDINTATLESIEILAAKIDKSIEVVGDFLKARYFHEKHFSIDPVITHEIIYGLLRFGLPYEYEELVALSDDDKTEALEATTESNIIDPLIIDNLTTILEALSDAFDQNSLIDDLTDDPSHISKILTIAGITENAKQRGFNRYFRRNKKNEDFWSRLVEDNILTQSESDAAKLVSSFSLIAQNHLPLIQNLWDDTSINSIEDVGSLSYDQWLAKINTSGIGIPYLDPPYNDSEDEEFAEAMITSMERMFPSRVLDKEIDEEIAGGATEFDTIKSLINSQDSYDIDFDSPRKKMRNLGGNFSNDQKEEVFRNRRLFHVFGKRGKAKNIRDFNSKKLRSSTQITKKGRRKFIKDQSDALGGKEEAEKVYKRAFKRKAASLAMHGKFGRNLNPFNARVTPPAPIPYLAEDIPEETPELEVFYGSLDYCNCKHCRSSVSPAAYLVDLLEFLKEAENMSNSSETAWDILKSRRSDITKIHLTCDNTNTSMPYIDLVNEVLEAEVNNAAVISRQTTSSSDEIRIMPQYLDRMAYDTIAEAVYSWSLPLNLWNEEASAYLDQLGAYRHAIVRASLGSTEQVDGMTIDEACVYLNISSKMLNDVLLSTTFTAFYGGATSATLSSVRELLNRTGLEYEELLDLTSSTFINPAAISITFNPISSCSIDDASLVFESSNYANLHRFYRFKELLNWGTYELDSVLSSLSATNITESVIIQLAGIQKLSHRFKLSALEVISWYSSLSTTSYDEEISQYEKIYLSAIYNSDEVVRAAFESVIASGPTPIEMVNSLGELNAENSAVVLAALRISSQDLMLMISELVNDGAAVSLSDLSNLYRVASFTRSLKISIAAYFDLKKVLGLLPLSEDGHTATPDDTLAFLTLYDLLIENNVSVKDLGFLFMNNLASYPNASKERRIVTIELIRNKLVEKLGAAGISNLQTDQDLLAMFLLFFKEQDAVTSLEIIKDRPVTPDDMDAASDFLDSYWADLIVDFQDDIATVKEKLISGGTGVIMESLDERINYVFTAFHSQVGRKLLFENEVSQTIADDYDGVLSDVDYLLKFLTDPSNAAKDAMSMFTRYEFVYSTDSIEVGNSAYQDHLKSLFTMQKVTTMIDKLKIDSLHIAFVLTSTSDTGWFDLTSFPDEDDEGTTWDFNGFVKLIRAFDLERSYATDSFSIIDLIQTPIESGVPDDVATQGIRQQLSAGTEWDLSDINFLCGQSSFISSLNDYTNEDWIWKLSKMNVLIRKVNVSAAQLYSWSSQDVTYEQAQSIRAGVRSNYSESSWRKTGAEIRDGLRIKQRDALTAYIIANNDDFKSTDDLYSHYLIDTEMAPCSLTSRIKLATSTVQLWVQRIRMDLEPGITFDDEEMDEWNWRKNYRVWEAARKVFLYPENWIEPELRDDKTSFFKDLEDELLQGEVTAESAELAYLNYLKKLDQVANLEIAASYQETDRKVFHVFARTKNDPHHYFHREFIDEVSWTDWKPIEVDIEGDHLIPVVFNRRIMLFWPIFNEYPEPFPDEGVTFKTNSSEIKGEKPKTSAEIKLAYTEWSNSKWQPKKLSSNRITSDQAFFPEDYFFKPKETSDGLYIDVFFEGTSHVGAFYLNNCTGEIIVKGEREAMVPSNYSISNAERHFMKIHSFGAKVFEITESFPNKPELLNAVDKKLQTNTTKLLNKVPFPFKVTYPVTDLEVLSESPFFYEDANRIFLIIPSDKTYTSKIVVSLKPEVITKQIKKTTTRLVPIVTLPPPKPKLIPAYTPQLPIIPSVSSIKPSPVSLSSVRTNAISLPLLTKNMIK